jgi:hypothetical protein
MGGSAVVCRERCWCRWTRSLTGGRFLRTQTPLARGVPLIRQITERNWRNSFTLSIVLPPTPTFCESPALGQVVAFAALDTWDSIKRC